MVNSITINLMNLELPILKIFLKLLLFNVEISFFKKTLYMRKYKRKIKLEIMAAWIFKCSFQK